MKHRYLLFDSKIATFVILTLAFLLLGYVGYMSQVWILMLASIVSFLSIFYLFTQPSNTRKVVYFSVVNSGSLLALSYQVWVYFAWPPSLWDAMNSWMLFIILALLGYEVVYYVTSYELRQRFMMGYRFIFNLLSLVFSGLMLYVRFNPDYLIPMVCVIFLVWSVFVVKLIHEMGKF